MSDISDSENISLSESVDVAGSTASTPSTRSSSVGEATGPRDRTPDHLSGISDIPSRNDPVMPTSRGQTGAARLEDILRAGPSTVPDRQFVEELGWTAQARPAPVVDLTAEGGDASERTASQASTSGRGDGVAFDSTDPSGEEIQARQRPRSRGARVNDMKVYRMADAEMIGLAGDRPVYTADYYTSAVTLRYLAALRRDFSIPEDVDLVVPEPNDLPSRPPSGHIALSAEYFRAGLRLPFHLFLRRALTSLNVAPAQLNANAYRVLVGCYILWAAKFSKTLPLVAFQNLYRMKTAPSSKGFYYFQGFKGTFITGCSDSDKQFKHLWFYAGGRWLHGHLSYFEFPLLERIPVAFRRGYVWTRAPHAPAQTLANIKELRELSDPERSQHWLLAEGSLKEHWVSSSSTSGCPDNQPRTAQPRVTIARMSEPAVHYRSRTSRPVVATADVRSGVPRGVPEATLRGSSSSDLSPGAWGPRVADEDLDLVIRELFPARGLRIEEPMTDRERRGTKRPSAEERIARLQKNARLGKGKDKEGASTVPSSGGAVPTVAAAKTGVPPMTQTSRPTSRPEMRTDRPREDWPREDRPREDRQPSRHEVRSGRSREDRPTVLPPVPRSGRDEPRPHDAPLPFGRSDHVAAISDSTAKLIETVCILFSGSAAAKAHATGWRTRAGLGGGRDLAVGMEMALKRAEQELAAAHAEHRRYLEVAFLAALDDARVQAVEEYLRSEDFRARLVSEYQEGMRDMEAEETATEGAVEEDEVTGAAPAPENVVVIDDPDQPKVPDQPVASEQPTAGQPTSPALDVSMNDLFQDQLD
ncbi:hypothetical protein TIFTF001_037348 [Ficus carica]|uniref:Uncharacterized protein n=1 Tax=Ficus carica TaxID=3494 RepID=A0AA88E653_FICCA|nr:hypothetical protein TIFTF001_037345 [Ficus carica]GMN68295.1 hypothetical protein TIFTF001_037348 [Ficus carica]